MYNSSNIIAEWRRKKNAIELGENFNCLGNREKKMTNDTRRFRPTLYFCKITRKRERKRERVNASCPLNAPVLSYVYFCTNKGTFQLLRAYVRSHIRCAIDRRWLERCSETHLRECNLASSMRTVVAFFNRQLSPTLWYFTSTLLYTLLLLNNKFYYRFTGYTCYFAARYFTFRTLPGTNNRSYLFLRFAFPCFLISCVTSGRHIAMIRSVLSDIMYLCLIISQYESR